MRTVARIVMLAGALVGTAAQAEPLPPFAVPGPRGDETPLVDHQPFNGGGLASDSMAFESPGSPIVYQYVADDFILASGSPVRRIKFYAFYNSNLLPSGDETIRVRFYDARPTDGLPGGVLREESFVNVPRVWTGRNVIDVGGGREYQFEVLLGSAFAAEPATQYWLEIAQIGDPTSSFRWEMSVTQPANSQAVKNENNPDWHLPEFPGIDPNTAFQLYEIPEPTTTLMLLVAMPVIMRVLRERRSF